MLNNIQGIRSVFGAVRNYFGGNCYIFEPNDYITFLPNLKMQAGHQLLPLLQSLDQWNLIYSKGEADSFGNVTVLNNAPIGHTRAPVED